MKLHKILGLAFALGCASGASAQEPAALLRQGIDEVLAVVYDGKADGPPLSARLEPVLERYFDLEAVTRRAVGPPWRSFTPAERDRTADLFADLVLRTYADSFQPGERPEVVVGQARVLTPRQHEIASTIGYRGRTFQVAYRMENTAAGWRIYDVIIEGVSMIANYRAQFDGIVRRGGAQALIRSLEENLESLAPKS